MGKKEKRKMKEKNENERKVLEGKIRFQREEVKFLCCYCLTAADVFQKVVFKHRTTHYRSKQRFQKKLRIREKVLRVAPQFDPGDSFNALLILQ